MSGSQSWATISNDNDYEDSDDSDDNNMADNGTPNPNPAADPAAPTPTTTPAAPLAATPVAPPVLFNAIRRCTDNTLKRRLMTVTSDMSSLGLDDRMSLLAQLSATNGADLCGITSDDDYALLITHVMAALQATPPKSATPPETRGSQDSEVASMMLRLHERAEHRYLKLIDEFKAQKAMPAAAVMKEVRKMVDLQMVTMDQVIDINMELMFSSDQKAQMTSILAKANAVEARIKMNNIICVMMSDEGFRREYGDAAAAMPVPMFHPELVHQRTNEAIVLEFGAPVGGSARPPKARAGKSVFAAVEGGSNPAYYIKLLKTEDGSTVADGEQIGNAMVEQHHSIKKIEDYLTARQKAEEEAAKKMEALSAKMEALPEAVAASEATAKELAKLRKAMKEAAEAHEELTEDVDRAAKVARQALKRAAGRGGGSTKRHTARGGGEQEDDDESEEEETPAPAKATPFPKAQYIPKAQWNALPPNAQEAIKAAQRAQRF